MRKLVYYVGASVDGYIAGPNGEIEDFPVSDDHLEQMVLDTPEVLPTHVRRQLGCDQKPNRRFDDIVMGRGTYDPATDVGISDPYAHLTTTVATTQPLAVPSHIAVTSDPAAPALERRAA